MSDLNRILDANRDAVREMIGAADRSGPAWTTPPAPGKWSPSQIVEHVARSLEESAHVVAGAPSNIPTLPFFFRPVARSLFFNRILKTGLFPKAKTNQAMNPATGPATPAEARGRLESALTRFDQECQSAEAAGRSVNSGAFGTVSLADYARFMELHTRHHCKQMTRPVTA